MSDNTVNWLRSLQNSWRLTDDYIHINNCGSRLTQRIRVFPNFVIYRSSNRPRKKIWHNINHTMVNCKMLIHDDIYILGSLIIWDTFKNYARILLTHLTFVAAYIHIPQDRRIMAIRRALLRRCHIGCLPNLRENVLIYKFLYLWKMFESWLLLGEIISYNSFLLRVRLNFEQKTRAPLMRLQNAALRERISLMHAYPLELF